MVVVVVRGLIWLVDDGFWFWAGLITTFTCTTGVVKREQHLGFQRGPPP